MKHPKIGIIMAQSTQLREICFAVHYIRELYVQLDEVYSDLNNILVHL
jgi:hypothetical protein